MPATEIAKARAEAEARHGASLDEPIAVHPANRAPLRLLLASATQWRCAALSTMASAQVVKTGLDYGVLDRVAALEGLPPIEPDVFRRLRLMEAECLAAWQEARR
ncbi:MAG: DUF1799 domain-containing protein [Caulobacter sp.]